MPQAKGKSIYSPFSQNFLLKKQKVEALLGRVRGGTQSFSSLRCLCVLGGSAVNDSLAVVRLIFIIPQHYFFTTTKISIPDGDRIIHEGTPGYPFGHLFFALPGVLRGWLFIPPP
jgi:hypothetical protein